MRCMRWFSAAALTGAAGSALAQPAVDGTLAGDEAFYGQILWVQNQPTGFGDNTATGSCDDDVSDAPFVDTGIEMAIWLGAIGYPSEIKLCALLNSPGHDYLSNQVLAGLPADMDSLGEPRAVNLDTLAGNQYVTVAHAAGGPPTMDGVLDGAGVYGTLLAAQTNPTTFGDNDDPSVDRANGSELDNIYASVDNDYLYIFIGGNLATSWNKLELFFDVFAGGQNRLRGDNPDVDYNGLNRLGDDGSGNGLTFDAAFAPDYYLTFTTGNDPAETHANFAELLTNGGGFGDYIGSGGTGTNVLYDAFNDITIALDNSNILGVTAKCPPSRPSRDWSIGSEIDGLYAYMDQPGNRLYLLVTGNLENNGNKLSLFFDTQPGGQSPLRGDNVDISFNGLNRMGEGEIGDPPVMAPGLTFDAGFAADWWLAFNNNQSPFVVYADSAVLRTDGPLHDFNDDILDYGAYDGGDKPSNDPIDFAGPRVDIQTGGLASLYCNYGPRLTQLDPANPVAGLIEIAIDNSNVDGVSDTSAAGAADVTTGIELSVDLDEIGWDGASDILVAGFIASGDYSYVSNQVLGGLPAADNLAEVRLIDFGTISGEQFVNVSAGPDCPPDLNGDGLVNSQDFIIFLNAFVAGDPLADWNDDGQVNSQDFVAFLNDFVRGC